LESRKPDITVSAWSNERLLRQHSLKEEAQEEDLRYVLIQWLEKKSRRFEISSLPLPCFEAHRGGYTLAKVEYSIVRYG
jgi:hypothetical protein